jgi:hypothetical protein
VWRPSCRKVAKVQKMATEILAVMLGQGFGVLWLVFKIDKRLAVLETRMHYIEQAMGD